MMPACSQCSPVNLCKMCTVLLPNARGIYFTPNTDSLIATLHTEIKCSAVKSVNTRHVTSNTFRPVKSTETFWQTAKKKSCLITAHCATCLSLSCLTQCQDQWVIWWCCHSMRVRSSLHQSHKHRCFNTAWQTSVLYRCPLSTKKHCSYEDANPFFIRSLGLDRLHLFLAWAYLQHKLGKEQFFQIWTSTKDHIFVFLPSRNNLNVVSV